MAGNNQRLRRRLVLTALALVAIGAGLFAWVATGRAAVSLNGTAGVGTLGTASPTCAAPANVRARYDLDNPDGPTITVTWDRVFNAIGYIIDFVDPTNFEDQTSLDISSDQAHCSSNKNGVDTCSYTMNISASDNLPLCGDWRFRVKSRCCSTCATCDWKKLLPPNTTPMDTCTFIKKNLPPCLCSNGMKPSNVQLVRDTNDIVNGCTWDCGPDGLTSGLSGSGLPSGFGLITTGPPTNTGGVTGQTEQCRLDYRLECGAVGPSNQVFKNAPTYNLCAYNDWRQQWVSKILDTYASPRPPEQNGLTFDWQCSNGVETKTCQANVGCECDKFGKFVDVDSLAGIVAAANSPAGSWCAGSPSTPCASDTDCQAFNPPVCNKRFPLCKPTACGPKNYSYATAFGNITGSGTKTTPQAAYGALRYDCIGNDGNNLKPNKNLIWVFDAEIPGSLAGTYRRISEVYPPKTQCELQTMGCGQLANEAHTDNYISANTPKVNFGCLNKPAEPINKDLANWECHYYKNTLLDTEVGLYFDSKGQEYKKYTCPFQPVRCYKGYTYGAEFDATGKFKRIIKNGQVSAESHTADYWKKMMDNKELCGVAGKAYRESPLSRPWPEDSNYYWYCAGDRYDATAENAKTENDKYNINNPNDITYCGAYEVACGKIDGQKMSQTAFDKIIADKDRRQLCADGQEAKKVSHTGNVVIWQCVGDSGAAAGDAVTCSVNLSPDCGLANDNYYGQGEWEAELKNGSTIDNWTGFLCSDASKPTVTFANNKWTWKCGDNDCQALEAGCPATIHPKGMSVGEFKNKAALPANLCLNKGIAVWFGEFNKPEKGFLPYGQNNFSDYSGANATPEGSWRWQCKYPTNSGSKEPYIFPNANDAGKMNEQGVDPNNDNGTYYCYSYETGECAKIPADTYTINQLNSQGASADDKQRGNGYTNIGAPKSLPFVCQRGILDKYTGDGEPIGSSLINAGIKIPNNALDKWQIYFNDGFGKLPNGSEDTAKGLTDPQRNISGDYAYYCDGGMNNAIKSDSCLINIKGCARPPDGKTYNNSQEFFNVYNKSGLCEGGLDANGQNFDALGIIQDTSGGACVWHWGCAGDTCEAVANPSFVFTGEIAGPRQPSLCMANSYGINQNTYTIKDCRKEQIKVSWQLDSNTPEVKGLEENYIIPANTLDELEHSLTATVTCDDPCVQSKNPVPAVLNYTIKATDSQPAVTMTMIPDASQQPVCKDDTIKFTAQIPGNCEKPSYKWYINNELQEGSNNSFTSAFSESHDAGWVKAIVHCDNYCQEGTALSSPIIIGAAKTQNASLLPLTASICVGGSVTFTAKADDNCQSPTYIWSGGCLPVAGQPEKCVKTYNSSGPDTSVGVIIHCASGCYADWDSSVSPGNPTITVKAKPNEPATVDVVPADLATCLGDTAVHRYEAVTHFVDDSDLNNCKSENLEYTWTVAKDGVVKDTKKITGDKYFNLNISDVNGLALEEGDDYTVNASVKCVDTCITAPEAVDDLTPATLAIKDLRAGEIEKADDICANSSPLILQSKLNANDAESLQWQNAPALSDGKCPEKNDSSWSDILGQTGQDYSAPLPILTESTCYQRVARSTICTDTKITLAIAITIKPKPTLVSLSPAPAEICLNSDQTYTATTANCTSGTVKFIFTNTTTNVVKADSGPVAIVDNKAEYTLVKNSLDRGTYSVTAEMTCVVPCSATDTITHDKMEVYDCQCGSANEKNFVGGGDNILGLTEIKPFIFCKDGVLPTDTLPLSLNGDGWDWQCKYGDNLPLINCSAKQTKCGESSTKCVGGINNGKGCNADADCPSGNCEVKIYTPGSWATAQANVCTNGTATAVSESYNGPLATNPVCIDNVIKDARAWTCQDSVTPTNSQHTLNCTNQILDCGIADANRVLASHDSGNLECKIQPKIDSTGMLSGSYSSDPPTDQLCTLSLSDNTSAIDSERGKWRWKCGQDSLGDSLQCEARYDCGWAIDRNNSAIQYATVQYNDAGCWTAENVQDASGEPKYNWGIATNKDKWTGCKNFHCGLRPGGLAFQGNCPSDWLVPKQSAWNGLENKLKAPTSTCRLDRGLGVADCSPAGNDGGHSDYRQDGLRDKVAFNGASGENYWTSDTSFSKVPLCGGPPSCQCSRTLYYYGLSSASTVKLDADLGNCTSAPTHELRCIKSGQGGIIGKCYGWGCGG